MGNIKQYLVYWSNMHHFVTHCGSVTFLAFIRSQLVITLRMEEFL